MLYIKFKGHGPAGFGEDVQRILTTYGHGSHLGHMTRIIWTLRLHMKFGIDWNSSFWEDVRRVWLTDGQTDGWTNGQQMDDRACLYYKTINEPKGSGELTMETHEYDMRPVTAH